MKSFVSQEIRRRRILAALKEEDNYCTTIVQLLYNYCMCIPCDWLLLGDVTNSLLKRNKPSILLSTCRVVYTLLVSSSCGSLYQCDFKTYNLVYHVQMLVVTHKQTDKRTDTQNDKTLSMCLHCGRPQHCLCHLSSLLIS